MAHLVLPCPQADDIHSLFFVESPKSKADVIKQIKSSSLHSINHHDFIPENFPGKQGMLLILFQNQLQIKFLNTFKIRNRTIKGQFFSRSIKNFLKLYNLNHEDK